MIRYLLLGGRWDPVPWQTLLALGLACLSAAGLFWVLYGRWSTEPLLGGAEVAILGLAAAVLITFGLRRRGRDRSTGPQGQPDTDRRDTDPRGPRRPG